MHSNGFSLVRRIVEQSGLGWTEPCPFDPKTSVGEALMTPTRIYVKSVLAAIKAGGVKALAHITGGGLVDNVPRVLPDTLQADIDGASWKLPAVFGWLMKTGGVPRDDLMRTFNCGIGMVVVVAPDAEARVTQTLQGPRRNGPSHRRHRDARRRRRRLRRAQHRPLVGTAWPRR